MQSLGLALTCALCGTCAISFSHSELRAASQWLIATELVDALSGERAKAHVVEISRWYREDATPGFQEAARYVLNQARKAGLDDVHGELFPVDGKTRRFGVQTRYGWAPRRAELWLVEPEQKLADFAEASTHLATWSSSAELEAPLVDIGDGRPADYAGRDVKGAVVFTSRPPADVQHEAVARRGAVGIVSWWSPPARSDFPDQIQWLDTANNRETTKTFAFVLSRRQGRAVKARLERGPVRVRVLVDAELGPGNLEVVSGIIRGRERADEEIVLVAHLCHFSPSSNDNASGSGLLLEIARAWNQLIDQGTLPRPSRTVRFLWVPENHGTIAYLEAHPELAERARAALSLDMVGEDLNVTNSIFRLVRTPDSRPSFLNDVMEMFVAGVAARSIVAPTGSRSEFRFTVNDYLGGSDHVWMNDAGVGVPAMLLMHWPDVFYHSSEDSPDKVDSTELRRVGVLALAASSYLASVQGKGAEELAVLVAQRGRARVAHEASRATAYAVDPVTAARAHGRMRSVVDREARAVQSVATLDLARTDVINQMAEAFRSEETAWVNRSFPAAPAASRTRSVGLRFARSGRYLSAAWRGHLASRLSADEYDRASAIAAALPHGQASAVELLNLADGRRTIEDIAAVLETQRMGDYLWNEYYGDGSMTPPPLFSGPAVESGDVLEFLTLAERAGLVRRLP